MIEIKVWGGGETWRAVVVKPSPGPEVSGARADGVVLRALTAYRHATDKSEVTCHRCGNVWRPRLKGAPRLPVLCPNCKQPPRYSALREIGLLGRRSSALREIGLHEMPLMPLKREGG